MDFAARAIQDRLRYREVRSSLSSQESSANQSILMYHSTLSTPKTAGKAPAPSPHTAVQTEGTLSFHKVEDENAWGIAADPTVPLKVESVLKVQLKRVGRDHGIFKAEVKKMRFNLVPNLFNTDQMKIVNTRWAGDRSPRRDSRCLDRDPLAAEHRASTPAGVVGSSVAVHPCK